MVEVATLQVHPSGGDQRPGCIMTSKAPQLELERLRKQQVKARADEVFGGLSRAERAAYDRRRDRIIELERDLSELSEEPERKLDLSWRNR